MQKFHLVNSVFYSFTSATLLFATCGMQDVICGFEDLYFHKFRLSAPFIFAGLFSAIDLSLDAEKLMTIYFSL